MEIKSTGFKMIDLPPGVEVFRVEPDQGSEFGVHVEIMFTGQERPLSYGVREFAELLHAMAAMRPSVRQLAQQYASEDERENELPGVSL